jgi:hypothetical protein
MREDDEAISEKKMESFDPYASPGAESDGASAPRVASSMDLRSIPLACLDRARTIRRVAWVNFILAIIWAPAAIGTALMSALIVLRAIGVNPVDYQFPADTPQGISWVALTTFHVGCFALNIAVGMGLRRLQPWARWAEVVIALLLLVVCLAYSAMVILNHQPEEWIWMTSVPGIALAGAGLWLLLSPTTASVFSVRYRESILHYR